MKCVFLIFLTLLLTIVSLTAQVYAQREQTETADTISVKKDGVFRRFFSNMKNSASSVDTAPQKKYIPEEKNTQSREYHTPSAEFSGNEDSLQIIIRNDSIGGCFNDRASKKKIVERRF